MAGGTLGENLRGTLTLPYAMVDWWYSHSVDEGLLPYVPTYPKHKPLTIRFVPRAWHYIPEQAGRAR